MYQRILVPIDGSATSNRGLDEAVKLAAITGAGLRLIHVINELTFASGFEIYTSDVIAILKQGGEQILTEATARVAAAGRQVTTHLSENFGSRVCDIVIDDAIAWPADLIVIGSHGRRGLGRLLIGSDAEQILRRSPVPVLLVHGTPVGNETSAEKDAGASAPLPRAVAA